MNAQANRRNRGNRRKSRWWIIHHFLLHHQLLLIGHAFPSGNKENWRRNPEPRLPRTLLNVVKEGALSVKHQSKKSMHSSQLQPPLRRVLWGPLQLWPMKLQIFLQIPVGKHHVSQLLHCRNHGGLFSPEHPQTWVGRPASNPPRIAPGAPRHGWFPGSLSKGFCTLEEKRGRGGAEQQAIHSSATCSKPHAPQPASRTCTCGAATLVELLLIFPTCSRATEAHGTSSSHTKSLSSSPQPARYNICTATELQLTAPAGFFPWHHSILTDH